MSTQIFSAPLIGGQKLKGSRKVKRYYKGRCDSFAEIAKHLSAIAKLTGDEIAIVWIDEEVFALPGDSISDILTELQASAAYQLK